MATATRELNFWLAAPEKRLLVAIAGRLPAWVTSNRLTAVGVLGAAGAGLAYALSGRHPGWLFVASALLALNWFGDSLDGTLARVRRAERPRYGYYLDHCVDAFSTAAIGLGIGLSPYVDVRVALLLVVAYLTLSINVYLESAVFGVFRLAYGRVGPTEARIILVLANGVLAWGTAAAGGVPPGVTRGASAVFLALALGMAGVLAVRFGKNLQALARLEPSRRR